VPPDRPTSCSEARKDAPVAATLASHHTRLTRDDRTPELLVLGHAADRKTMSTTLPGVALNVPDRGPTREETMPSGDRVPRGGDV
jgi:hypothetical protein